MEGKPEAKRARRDFERVIDAYRKVYHIAPSSNRADASALAVAELLDEQGRILNDPKSFKDAVVQLEFLRREYPGKYRGDALFMIAEISRDDLNDSTQARAAFQEFLQEYPHVSASAKARAALKEMDAEAKGGKPGKKKVADATTSSRAKKEKAKPESSTVAGESRSSANEREVSVPEDATPRNDRHSLALLTKVRYWSTSDYTRVAIDLEQEVQYEAGRMPHPDRIFFDLYGTKLASNMAGKSFAVEDGFLHKIRVAQFKPNLARVVLDVDEVADYSAFLLPNPYRLIIDIHGKRSQNQAAKGDAKLPNTTSRADVTSPGPASSSAQLKPQQDARAPVRTTVEEQKPDTKAERKSDSRLDSEIAAAPTQAAKTNSVKGEPLKAEDTDIEMADKATARPTTAPTFKTVLPDNARDKRTGEPEASAPAASTRVAAPTASGQRSLTRALGLKIGKIVVDAGHGGHDTGTIGPNGLREKDLVLDVALKLGKLLEYGLGAEVVYTREDDTFIPLETRTAIANKEQADLFISIHANSSRDASARGVETYYLNFTSSADALEVAARENSVSEKSIHELQDLVKKIALKEKIEESREFAADVQKSLYTGLNAKNPGLHNRGVKKAPFVVLIGANMPSILAEISFVSNPTDEMRLQTNDYRQRVAESLYKGIAKYTSGLSGVRVAAKPDGMPSAEVTASFASK